MIFVVSVGVIFFIGERERDAAQPKLAGEMDRTGWAEILPRHGRPNQQLGWKITHAVAGTQVKWCS